MPKTLVVISHFDQRSTEPLSRLLDSIMRFNAGAEYDCRIVVNSTRHEPIALLERHTPFESAISYRENAGMNIGAWDFGWRSNPHYDYYLFLQDECCIVQDEWLRAFQEASDRPDVGMVGESINLKWNQDWESIKRTWGNTWIEGHYIDDSPADRVTVYQKFMHDRGIPFGETGRHLRSLVWFLRNDVLTRINGFPIGNNFGECIGAEIAVTKMIEACGLQVTQVADQDFCYIQHREWQPGSQLKKAAAGEKNMLTNKKFTPGEFSPYGIPFTTDSRYAVKERHDLLALLPSKFRPSSILEVGCANGQNLRYFSNALNIPSSRTVGVDICRSTTADYSNMIFHHSSAEAYFDSATGLFDLILLSDVLEHIYNPWALLHSAKRCLAPNGCILISVPNAQNLNYISAAVSGEFLYQSTGLFDETHIRFFSQATLSNYVKMCGYNILHVGWRPDSSLAELRNRTQTAITKESTCSLHIASAIIQITRENIDCYFGQQILMAVAHDQFAL